MKTILLILFTALSSCSYNYRHAIAPAALSAVSGACYGVHETVVHHPDRIPDTWNRQWWDSRISWTNKGTTTWGKTFGSTGSDAKHTFGPLHRWTLFGAGITVGIGKRRPWWHYGIDAAVSFAAFSIGFHSTYTIAFRQ